MVLALDIDLDIISDIHLETVLSSAFFFLFSSNIVRVIDVFKVYSVLYLTVSHPVMFCWLMFTCRRYLKTA